MNPNNILWMVVIISRQNARMFATKMAIQMVAMEGWQATDMSRTEAKPNKIAIEWDTLEKSSRAHTKISTICILYTTEKSQRNSDCIEGNCFFQPFFFCFTNNARKTQIYWMNENIILPNKTVNVWLLRVWNSTWVD